MIDKIKTILTLILIGIVVFSVAYSVVMLIISAFEEPEIITLNNIYNYKVEENLIISYTTYYYYETCLNNFIEACEKELYDELYNIYITDYEEKSSKEEIINSLKIFNSMLKAKDMDDVIAYKLEKLYSVDNKYLAEVSINGNIVHVVFSEASSKDLSYNFALVK